MDTNFMNLVAIVKVYHLTLVVTLYFSRIQKLQFLFTPQLWKHLVTYLEHSRDHAIITDILQNL